jgi:hypothetical protein
MKNQEYQYYMHDGPTAFRFELTGHLNHAAARSLDQDWRTASSTIGDRRLIVDITFVTGADEQGRALITRWHQQGARLIANSKASLALAESILGEHLREASSEIGAAAGSDRARLPFRASPLVNAVTVFLLAAMVFPVEARAAVLRPETVNAWEDYLETVNMATRTRDRGPAGYLRVHSRLNWGRRGWSNPSAHRTACPHAFHAGLGYDPARGCE